MGTQANLPKWYRQMEYFRALKTTFTIERNTYDLYYYPIREGEDILWSPVTLDQYLYNYLTSSGYQIVVFYNHIDGFHNKYNPQAVEDYLKNVKEEGGSGDRKAATNKAAEMIRISLLNREKATAVVLNFASRYISSPDQLTDEERDLYTRLHLASLTPVQAQSCHKSIYINNLLFLICEKLNHIPSWFYLGNPNVKNLNIENPDKLERKRFIDSQERSFLGTSDYDPEELAKYKDRFLDLTEGFSNIELNGLKILCKQENIPFNRIADAINLYRYGIKENPWDSIDRKKLENAEAVFTERVKGQKPAINQTLDMLKRAVSGMAGIELFQNSNRPKGVLFFAGPAGTGKTELAKALAGFLFGDDSHCICFDMRGYAGYEAGGQLINALKENPFSVLLFEEIEKAHPSILDKLLQILDDGRMIDGKGETVYFSESIIIFTSNIGVFKSDGMGIRTKSVSPKMLYDDIKDNIIKGIRDYFISDLGRPEILNRMGNNFVVFDYIREDAAKEILESQLKKIGDKLGDSRNIVLQISPPAFSYLLEKSINNLEYGGRGIGNIVEKYFSNPISRFFFDNSISEDTRVLAEGIAEVDGIVSIHCTVSPLAGD